jgi:hypothetical protein
MRRSRRLGIGCALSCRNQHIEADDIRGDELGVDSYSAVHGVQNELKLVPLSSRCLWPADDVIE